MTSISISQLKQECTKLLSDNLETSSREISLELNQILLYVLKINNSQLLLKKTISKAQYEKIKKFVTVRARGKPLAYIFKEWSFYGRAFYINSSMLIPRPDRINY